MKNKNIETTTNFGYHLVFDAYGCPIKKLNSKKMCEEVLNQAVIKAKMHKIGEPHIIKASGNETLGGKDPGGFSGFVIIQESHISIHTFAKRGFVSIDIYSCKEFETKEVIKYLKEVFEPKEVDVLEFKRGMKYPTQNIYK